jgi:transcription elongation GreA/GreB family factor
VERPRISQAIAEARAHGDLKENAEYHAAKEQQGLAEARIREIEYKLSHAEIIDVTHAQRRRQGGVRRHRGAVLRTEETRAALPDRRRGGGRHPLGVDLDLLADRACADRQERG